MPKKKVKAKLLETREYKGIEYRIYQTEKGLAYVTSAFGDDRDFSIRGKSKRSLTIKIKKEIDMRLKIDKEKPEEKVIEEETSDIIQMDSLSEDELEDMFNVDNYSDKKNKIITELPSVKEMVRKDKEKKSSKKLKKMIKKKLEEDTPPTKKKVLEQIDTFEEEEQDELITPEDLAKDKDIVKEDALKQNFKHLKGEIKFIISDGIFYGKVGRTALTIRNNKFKAVAINKFRSVSRSKNLSVATLIVQGVNNVFPLEVIIRFLMREDAYDIKRFKGSFVIVPTPDEIQQYGNVLMDTAHIVILMSKVIDGFKFGDNPVKCEKPYFKGGDIYYKIKGEEYVFNKVFVRECQEIMKVIKYKQMIDINGSRAMIMETDDFYLLIGDVEEPDEVEEEDYTDFAEDYEDDIDPYEE